MNTRVSLLAVLALAGVAAAETKTWSYTNPAGRYEDELLRLKMDFDAPLDPQTVVVTEDGETVPFQVDGKHVWVLTSMDPGQKHTWKVVVHKGKVARAVSGPLVFVDRAGGKVTLRNDRFAVAVPDGADAADAPGPVAGVRLREKLWAGASEWQTKLTPRKQTTEVLADGPLFAKVRVRTEFEPTDAVAEPFSEITLTLRPHAEYTIVEEHHDMAAGDAWVLELTKGMKATGGMMRRWRKAPFQGDEALRQIDLTPGQTRLGHTLMTLQPRWTQAFDEGWFFAACDAESCFGAIPARAGRWFWPHENLLEVLLRDSGDYAALHMPTDRGRRWWMLLAAPKADLLPRKVEYTDRRGRKKARTTDPTRALVSRAAMRPLNKIAHEYITAWEGMDKGGFAGAFFYAGYTDPTSGRRGQGRGAVKAAKQGKPGALSTLTSVQVNFDPDWYGSYWNRWSPINPNFFTDFMKLPIANACRLEGHPQFKRFARLAEQVFREDVYHSVTLPGGAGQECPGYQAHGMSQWVKLAGITRKHLGFDPTKWPRFKAAARFLVHVSQPDGAGKRKFHPGGDTHPGRPDPVAYARQFGVRENVRKFKTEELPGFGVIFRNKPGTAEETYLAFKSGPNRGHYHGDQLSIHYCADARKLAIDHHCSYSPRPGQEHMHNRVSFSTDDWPYANMDGYERVLALKTSDVADLAVGQVESKRIRFQKKLPPEDWDAVGPYKHFEKPLVYRRTIVGLKDGAGDDYFVIRDQYRGPELTATYNLHVLNGKTERSDRLIDMGRLQLFCATPEAFEFESFPWSHDRGGGEKTAGARLSRTGGDVEFVTVLYPGGKAPKMESIDGGVRVTVGDQTDEIVFTDAGWPEPLEPGGAKAPKAVTVTRDGKVVLTLGGAEFDLDRSQGKVGLFVPDCGYDFGPIPKWLSDQRSAIPDWADLELRMMGGVVPNGE